MRIANIQNDTIQQQSCDVISRVVKETRVAGGRQLDNIETTRNNGSVIMRSVVDITPLLNTTNNASPTHTARFNYQ